MDATTIRAYGAIIISVLVTLVLMAIAIFAYVTRDQQIMQLVAGAVVAQFSIVVGFWVGSSSSSQQKDEALLRAPPTPPRPPTT